MPMKPLAGLAVTRRARPATRKMAKAKSNRVMMDERLKNLAKARRVRKKNLKMKRAAAKQ